MNDGQKSRKWQLTLLMFFANCAALGFNYIDGGQWINLLIAIMAYYGTANVTEKIGVTAASRGQGDK